MYNTSQSAHHKSITSAIHDAHAPQEDLNYNRIKTYRIADRIHAWMGGWMGKVD